MLQNYSGKFGLTGVVGFASFNHQGFSFANHFPPRRHDLWAVVHHAMSLVHYFTSNLNDNHVAPFIPKSFNVVEKKDCLYFLLNFRYITALKMQTDASPHPLQINSIGPCRTSLKFYCFSASFGRVELHAR